MVTSNLESPSTPEGLSAQAHFAELVDCFYAPLYRFALSLARSSADACDLTQQAFLIWSTKGGMLRDRSKAKAWLFTTLYREFMNSRRHRQRMVAIDDLPPAEQELPDVEIDLAERSDSQWVLEALQEVDLVFRVPLTLFYLRDLSYREIADILAVPMGTVMSRLSRGKAQLRARLARKENAATGGGFLDHHNSSPVAILGSAT